MADNTQKRSDYLSDSYASKGKDPANDPLAELARLIGQGDPFAEQGLRKPQPLRADDRPAAPEWLARPPAAQEHDEHDYEPHPAPRNDYAPEDGYHAEQEQYELGYEEPAQPPRHEPRSAPRLFSTDARHHQDDRYSDEPQAAQAAYQAGSGDAQYQDHQEQSYQGDDRYRVAPPPAGDYDADSYYAEDGHMPPHGEEHAGGGRRRGILTIAAVLGLAAVGTAGAFGYRAFTGGSSGPANPPVIKADTTPAKIVPPAPATATSDAAGKPFQDRVGAAAPAAERVVPREEQPVSLQIPQQRAAAPVPPPAQATPAPQPAGPSLASSGEPKRVKTLSIRPDGAETTAAFPSQPQPQQPSPPPPAGGQTRSAAPKQPAQQSSSGGSAPMAIAPQAEPSSRTKVASRPTQTQAGSGGYVVQVSAQKTEAEAQSSYRSLQTKYPSVLAGRDASIRRVELGGSGVWYRAQVGSFASASAAEEFCGRLKSAGGQCIVQRN